MKKFTFGILTYNQEKYILQTLESIKYQKCQYGQDIDVSLVITDDASKDQTVAVMEKWLENNREYFDQIDLIANKNNRGTVANFCTILSKVENQGLKIIAGDDLIGCKNLFCEYNDLTDKKLKTYLRIELCDGKVYFREKYLIDLYYHKMQDKTRKYNLKNFRSGRYLHTPSTLYTKQLFLNADCENNLAGYKLFEDDPMWYSMIKNEKELEIDFLEQGIVLYRMHNQSVSNVPNPIFREDLRRLREQFMEDAIGLEKLYLKIKNLTNKWPMYINPAAYVNKFINMKRKHAVKKDAGYQKFKEKIEQQILEEQKFYDEIMETIRNNVV